MTLTSLVLGVVRQGFAVSSLLRATLPLPILSESVLKSQLNRENDLSSIFPEPNSVLLLKEGV